MAVVLGIGGRVNNETARRLRQGMLLALLSSMVFELWLIFEVGGRGLSMMVDDWAGPAFPVVAVAGGYLICRLKPRQGARRAVFLRGCGDAGRWASLFLSLGVLGYSAGSYIRGHFDLAAHQLSSLSAADAGYLSAYPFLLCGIVLLTRRAVIGASRIRLTVDSLLVMTAATTFSWYFVLGPTLHQGGGTMLERAAAIGHPVFDLVLIYCLFLLGFRHENPALRPIMRLLALGLGAIVIGDSVAAYVGLHGIHAARNLMDPTWSMGYMVVALCAAAVPQSAAGSPLVMPALAVNRRPMWQALLPYGLVPAVAALGAYAWHSDGGMLQVGVFVGAAVLVLLIFLHQVLVVFENDRLYERVNALHIEALRRSNERYHELFENASDLVFTLDPEGNFTTLNPATERIIGYTREEARRLHISQVIAPECLPDVTEMLQQEEPGGDHGQREITVLGRDGKAAVLEVVSQPVYHDERWVGVQSIARDITERKRAEAMLEHQAMHDALTDLPNRSLLYDRIDQAILSGRRHSHKIALLLMDLDRFKEINDTLGHHHGDLVLQEAARRLSDILRESDTVARLGGDEFAVLLPMTDEPGAVITAEKIIEALSDPFSMDDHSLHLGASVGIALCPEHGDDAVALLRRADVAMYAAKRGKTGCIVYAPEHDENTPGRLQMISDLRQAMEQDELVLHYQPKVSVHSGHVESVEALVRWAHPDLGMIPPDKFLPLAEHSGLIKQLALWVLNAALRQCRLWHVAGIDLRVAVNLSVENLRDPQMVGTITDLLKTWRVPPSRLQIEITESTIMVDPKRTMRTLTRLKDMGVKIALDDFGTGYSSLAYLRQLPVHEIKIDRSFITDLGTSENGLSIVRTINDLGQGLGMEIVAEGVEDRETLEVLALIGCDAAQGYYLSRPIAAPDLSTWLEERARELDRISA